MLMFGRVFVIKKTQAFNFISLNYQFLLFYLNFIINDDFIFDHFDSIN